MEEEVGMRLGVTRMKRSSSSIQGRKFNWTSLYIVQAQYVQLVLSFTSCLIHVCTCTWQESQALSQKQRNPLHRPKTATCTAFEAGIHVWICGYHGEKWRLHKQNSQDHQASHKFILS